MSVISEERHRPQVSIWNDPRIRAYGVQLLLLLAIVWFGYEIVSNTITNLRARNIASGFAFLNSTAGFDVIQSLIDFSETSTYGRAFLVGLLNTLLVAALGIVSATALGFLIGVMRLSKNWIVAKIATIYVEVVRNIPLLLQMFVWYRTVLKALPGPRQSLSFLDSFFLSNRGLMSPRPIFEPGSGLIPLAFVLGCIGAFWLTHWARRRQEATGEQFPVVSINIGLIIGLPLLVYLIMGRPITFEYPVLQGFNFTGGVTIIPEFMALYIALTIYTASFIAEIVRAGIQSVSHGQTEASHALGLRPGPTLRLVVIPQAMRVIIPPLTSQYLNLTKNSSLAVAIGYPDLVATGGTILNQTGQAVEIIMMWMGVYLTISLLTSGFMNWFNARMRLVER